MSSVSTALDPQTTTLWAGVARVTITPSVVNRLTGKSAVATPLIGFAGRGPATGVSDDLTATVLALGDAISTSCLLISLDLLWLDDILAARTRVLLAEAVGINPDWVLLAATHTHYGPPAGAGDFPCPGADQMDEYHESLIRCLINAARSARDDRCPVSAIAACGESAVGVNRRESHAGEVVMGVNPTGPVDGWVGTVQLIATDDAAAATDRTVCTIVNVACHPVCHGGVHDKISADYPMILRRSVESAIGGLCLVLQGACGDVNPVQMGTPDAADQTGAALGLVVLNTVRKGRCIAVAPPVVTRTEHWCRPWLPQSLERAQSELENLHREEIDIQDNNRRIWIAHRRRQLQAGVTVLRGGVPAAPRRARLAVISLGPQLAVATSPGEVFSELGTQIRSRSPFLMTLFAGYTDGMLHYLPTAEEFDRGGYEVDHGCVVQAGEPELLRDLSVSLLTASFYSASTECTARSW